MQYYCGHLSDCCTDLDDDDDDCRAIGGINDWH
jgi:hypothetical protein